MIGNKLEHLKEFDEIIHSYRISSEAKKILAKTPFVGIVAATSSGRNTIINELIKTGEYYFIVSDTTRLPRANNGVMERNGREYWFRSEADFLEDLKKGLYIEAEVIHMQQVSGVSVRELKKAKDQGKTAITDMDIEGIENILRVKPDALAICILPPSFEEWQNRIRGRGEMPEDEFIRRMRTAVRIFKETAKNTQIKYVVNDDIKTAVNEVDSIVKGNVKKQEETKKLVTDLLIKTEKLLSNT